ncbi:MAG: succinate dehydrogenase/fumarate reductase flavoprotein subunit, partial [Candidatus Thermoplasmatota archaeon]|nr:succinate dehydrogenase/fumarate reductase flavoprotein subunit [Candidatus Thermoplasmatota archaeon]
ANRLGGNSLLETVVFGRRAGKEIGETLKKKEKDKEEIKKALEIDKEEINRLLHEEGDVLYSELMDELREVMFEHFGVYREEESMKKGLSKIKELKEKYDSVHIDNQNENFNTALIRTLELKSMVNIAEVVAMGSIERKESRGSHFRRDYTERRDEEYLYHTKVEKTEGGPKLRYEDVTLGQFKVKEREY